MASSVSSSISTPKAARSLAVVLPTSPRETDRYPLRNPTMTARPDRLTNYAAFRRRDGASPQIGHVDHARQTVQPLALLSGTPVNDLYEVIEAGRENVVAGAGPAIPLRDVRLLPPISGRDVLAVGKNYAAHAREFNGSGYDSSDKVDEPSHPVIFTKRATSIVADGEDILLHEDFTGSADYEGEIGVIVGKAGFRVREADAWDHVWGYTIINDLTARERQRDHKQFYIGKSPDTFCPMGPVAVPKEDLPKTLRIRTRVNGELRQDATTEDLIFSIPHLISTLSAGTTLQPGDPAGVGIGRNPPVFLRPGDEVAISVDGIGTLKNKVADRSAANPTIDRVTSRSAFRPTNAARTDRVEAGLTEVNSKLLNYERVGNGKQNIVFVHGLGATKEFWTPLIPELDLEGSESATTFHLYDFEGHGLSPTHPLSEISIGSLAEDLAGVFEIAGVTAASPAVLVGHAMGCVVSLKFALDRSPLVKKLVLVGPPASPLPPAAAKHLLDVADLVRSRGMGAVLDQNVAALSENTRKKNPLAATAVRLGLLGQDPEAYAKAASALARFTEAMPLEKLDVETLVVSGQDRASCDDYVRRIRTCSHATYPEIGDWHVFESSVDVSRGIKAFLR